VTDPPEKGKANEKVLELLAYHLAVPKSSVRIIAGKSARIKIIDVGWKIKLSKKRREPMGWKWIFVFAIFVVILLFEGRKFASTSRAQESKREEKEE
jgi:hypothetical protein